MIAQFRGYILERACINDSVLIRRLEKLIFPKDAYPIFEIWMLFLSPRVHNFKLLSQSGDLIGFLALSLPLFVRHHAWIITIGIHADHQRRGLGRFLMTWAEVAYGLQRIRLTVRASNQPAIALYKQIGYREVNRRRRYYMDGEDGFVMEKDCAITAHNTEGTQ